MRTLEINPRYPFIEKLMEEIPEDDATVPPETKDFL